MDELQFKAAPMGAIETQQTWEAPSNIALIKYWGKYGEQLPKNPSLSLTLSQCVTQTNIQITPRTKSQTPLFDFYFEGQRKPTFNSKIEVFLNRILPYCPWVLEHHLKIHSQNTFPHSSGIASSASAMAALASGLVAVENLAEDKAAIKASFLARLGSGSAARSVNGPLMVWGAYQEVSASSNHFAVSLPEADYHPVFKSYRDTILLIDQGQKQVSSSKGHQLMENHPFAEARWNQADNHMKTLLMALKEGDLERFMTVVEAEALSLHGLMMTATPGFILMHPNTLAVLQQVWAFRKESGLPLCFTLDAGANVHLLYPKKQAAEIEQWIKGNLAVFCQRGEMIHDKVGTGAKKV